MNEIEMKTASRKEIEDCESAMSRNADNIAEALPKANSYILGEYGDSVTARNGDC